MTPVGRNGHVGWRLVISPAIMQRLRALSLEAEQHSDLERFVAALRVVHRRLRTDPDYFGEPLYRLRFRPGEVRHAARVPLVVAFAVLPADRAVWLTNAWLLTLPDPTT